MAKRKSSGSGLSRGLRYAGIGGGLFLAGVVAVLLYGAVSARQDIIREVPLPPDPPPRMPQTPDPQQDG